MADDFQIVGRVEISSNAEAMSQLKRELEPTTGAMGNLSSATGKTEAELAALGSTTGKTGEKVQGVGEKVRGVGDESEKMKEKTHGMFGGMSASALAATASLGGLAVVADKSLHTYEDYGKQVSTSAKLLGGSAQQVSTIVGQIKLTTGASTDASTSIGLFARNIGKIETVAKTNAPVIANLQQQITSLSGEHTKGAAAEITKLQDSIAKIEAKGTPAGAVLQRLGINVKDASGNWKTGAELFTEFRDALSKETDASQRASDASALLGRGYKALMPYITAPKEKIDSLAKSLNDMGMVMSSKDLEKFRNIAGDQKMMAMYSEALQFKLGELIGTIEQNVMPAVIKLSNWGEKALNLFSKLPGPVQTLAVGFAGLLVVSKLLAPLGQVKSAITSIVSGAKSAYGALAKLMGWQTGAAKTPAATGSGAGSTTATDTNTKVENANTEAVTRNTAAAKRSTLATDGETSAADKNILSTKASTLATKESKVATELETVASKKSALASDLSSVKLGKMGSKAETAANDVLGMGGSSTKAEKGIMGMNASSIKTAATLGGLAIALAFTINQLNKLASAIDEAYKADQQANQAKSNALGEVSAFDKKITAKYGSISAYLEKIAAKFGKDSSQYRAAEEATSTSGVNKDWGGTPWATQAAHDVTSGVGKAYNWAFGGGQATGGDYLVDKPTLFLAGESGKERATFTPQDKESGGTGDTFQLVIHSQAKTEQVAQDFHVLRAMAVRGV